MHNIALPIAAVALVAYALWPIVTKLQQVLTMLP